MMLYVELSDQYAKRGRGCQHLSQRGAKRRRYGHKMAPKGLELLTLSTWALAGPPPCGFLGGIIDLLLGTISFDLSR